MDDFAKVAMDKMAAEALRGGYIGNGSLHEAVIGKVNAAQRPELRNAIERAQGVCEGLNDLHIRLTSHIDRILGVEPANKLGDDDVNQPDCEMSALRNALSDMADAENRIRTQVGRLARL